jgi:predicted phage-related endonuclease
VRKGKITLCSLVGKYVDGSELAKQNIASHRTSEYNIWTLCLIISYVLIKCATISIRSTFEAEITSTTSRDISRSPNTVVDSYVSAWKTCSSSTVDTTVQENCDSIVSLTRKTTSSNESEIGIVVLEK